MSARFTALASTSTILAPEVVGDHHYNVARRVQEILQRYKELQDIIAILGLDGVFTPVEETVDSFEQLVNGDLDDLPEQAFLNVGGADSARAKAAELLK